MKHITVVRLQKIQQHIVRQYPETIAEFGHLEPICQVCGKPLKRDWGLVTFNTNRQGEIDKSTIRVHCKLPCDDRLNKSSREADCVFANLPEQTEENDE